MSSGDIDVSRRRVLQTGVAVAAGLGAAGTASAAECDDELMFDECVVTNTDAEAAKDCPGDDIVWEVPEGTLGTVVECCDHGVKVHFECIDETWVVSSADLDGGQICFC